MPVFTHSEFRKFGGVDALAKFYPYFFLMKVYQVELLILIAKMILQEPVISERKEVIPSHNKVIQDFHINGRQGNL